MSFPVYLFLDQKIRAYRSLLINADLNAMGSLSYIWWVASILLLSSFDGIPFEIVWGYNGYETLGI